MSHLHVPPAPPAPTQNPSLCWEATPGPLHLPRQPPPATRLCWSTTGKGGRGGRALRQLVTRPTWGTSRGRFAPRALFPSPETPDTPQYAIRQLGRPGRHPHGHTAAGPGRPRAARPVRRCSLQRCARSARTPRHIHIGGLCGRRAAARAAGAPLRRGRRRPQPKHLLARATPPPAAVRPPSGAGRQGLGVGAALLCRACHSPPCPPACTDRRCCPPSSLLGSSSAAPGSTAPSTMMPRRRWSTRWSRGHPAPTPTASCSRRRSRLLLRCCTRWAAATAWSTSKSTSASCRCVGNAGRVGGVGASAGC